MSYVRMMDVERRLLEEICDARFKRDDVALTYAFGLRQNQDDEIDWAKVNRAIVERWSLAGLKYIKEQAWKRVEEQR